MRGPSQFSRTLSPTVRTPRRAVSLLVEDLQRAISCVTRSVLIADIVKGQAKTDPVAFSFQSKSARAKARRGLWISVAMTVEPREDDDATGTWRTHTTWYDYAIFGSEDGSDEWLSYHFHPETHRVPHLHVNVDPQWGRRGFRKHHLPTGRVVLEDFVQLLIDEFGVKPLKRGWQKVLRDNRAFFADRRTW